MLFAAKKEKAVKTEIRSWQLTSPSYQADTTGIDTSYLNLPLRDYNNDYSISNAWNGNMISPIQSRLYFRRLHKIDDLFGCQYQPYIITAKDIRFYNSTVPYSSVAYKKGFTNGEEENEINFFFTGNINRRLNVGLGLNYVNGVGHYSSQEGKLFNGQVFGSYDGTHYSLHAAVAFNTLSNFENGGIKQVEDLNSPLKTMDIPVLMKGMSGYSYVTGFLQQKYSICTEKDIKKKIEFTNDFGEADTRDTIITEYLPMFTFAHIFETNNSRRRYKEKDAMQQYYEHTYRNTSATNDSTNVLTISNTVSVTFEEAYNRVLRFGATAFVRNECQRFLYGDVPHHELPFEEGIGSGWINDYIPPTQWMTDTLFRQRWTNNTFVGGSIYKRLGSVIRYDATGEVCVAGYKIGEFDVNGHVDLGFRVGKDSMQIQARAMVKNETPSPYLQQFESNHLRWENDFKKSYRIAAGGSISYPTTWVKPRLDFDFENITRSIYFDYKGAPHQHEGSIQILSADAQVDITTPWVNLENHVVWQHSSSEYMPIPTLTLFHNLYYHGCWFHAMDAQIGANVRYFTRYNAPLLNPATGQFCVQNPEEAVAIGNYPVIDLYANFYVHLIHLKFFAQCTHFNHLFMKENINYLAMPGYPMNPTIFRAGLAWHFLR